MSEKLELTDGIVLHALAFRDHDKILTLFTSELGLVKAIMRKSMIPKLSRGAFDPLTRAEFVLAKGKSDLYRCRDISIQNQHFKLREKLSWLTAACDMAHGIQTSQLLEKPAPDLYRLFISFLERLPLTSDPSVLVSSFYLKLMRHEGLISLSENCSMCSAPLTTHHLARGESFCPKHAPMPNFSFAAEEIQTLKTLNYSRSFKELAAVELSPSFASKVKELFTNLFN